MKTRRGYGLLKSVFFGFLVVVAVLNSVGNVAPLYSWAMNMLKKKPKSVFDQLEYSIPCLSPLSEDPDKSLDDNKGYFKKAIKEGPQFICPASKAINSGSNDFKEAISDKNMDFFLKKSEINDNLKQMLSVPESKGVLPGRGGLRLHHYSHYEDLTLRDWERYVLLNADPLGIKCGDSVFEVGVGSGAFVQVLQRYYDAKTSGIDLAKPLIELATRSMPGTYCTASAGSGLGFISDGVFDHVISHAVFFYLHGATLVHNIVRDMVRVLKPGGIIGVLCNNGVRGTNMTGKAKNKQSVSDIYIFRHCICCLILHACHCADSEPELLSQPHEGVWFV
jgi:SAM-dependent methyltransferase